MSAFVASVTVMFLKRMENTWWCVRSASPFTSLPRHPPGLQLPSNMVRIIYRISLDTPRALNLGHLLRQPVSHSNNRSVRKLPLGRLPGLISPTCSDRGQGSVEAHLNLPHSPRRVTRDALSENGSYIVFLHLRVGKCSFAVVCTTK